MRLHSCTRLCVCVEGGGWGGRSREGGGPISCCPVAPQSSEARVLKISQLPFSVLPCLGPALAVHPYKAQAGRQMMVLKGISWCHFQERVSVWKPDFQVLPVPTDRPFLLWVTPVPGIHSSLMAEISLGLSSECPVGFA